MRLRFFSTPHTLARKLRELGIPTMCMTSDPLRLKQTLPAHERPAGDFIMCNKEMITGHVRTIVLFSPLANQVFVNLNPHYQKGFSITDGKTFFHWVIDKCPEDNYSVLTPWPHDKVFCVSTAGALLWPRKFENARQWKGTPVIEQSHWSSVVRFPKGFEKVPFDTESPKQMFNPFIARAKSRWGCDTDSLSFNNTIIGSESVSHAAFKTPNILPTDSVLIKESLARRPLFRRGDCFHARLRFLTNVVATERLPALYALYSAEVQKRGQQINADEVLNIQKVFAECRDEYLRSLNIREWPICCKLKDRENSTFRICRHLAQKDGKFYLSASQLGMRLGVHQQIAFRILEKLQRMGALEIVKKGDRITRSNASTQRLATEFRYRLQG